MAPCGNWRSGRKGRQHLCRRSQRHGQVHLGGEQHLATAHGSGGNGVWSRPPISIPAFTTAAGRPLMAFSLTNARLSSATGHRRAHTLHLSGTFRSSGNGTEMRSSGHTRTPRPPCPCLCSHESCHGAVQQQPGVQWARPIRAGNKNIAPVVADGKVFVATRNSVAVFGLLN